MARARATAAHSGCAPARRWLWQANGMGDPMPRRVHHLIRIAVHLVQERLAASCKKRQAQEILHGASRDGGLTRNEADLFRKNPRPPKEAASAAAGTPGKDAATPTPTRGKSFADKGSASKDAKPEGETPAPSASP